MLSWPFYLTATTDLINFIIVTCKIWRKIGLGHETSMAETETRPRRWQFSSRQDRDETSIHLETVARPRCRHWDHNPVRQTLIRCWQSRILNSETSKNQLISYNMQHAQHNGRGTAFSSPAFWASSLNHVRLIDASPLRAKHRKLNRYSKRATNPVGWKWTSTLLSLHMWLCWPL